ncbi:integrator complex subunit 10 [Hyalella azteca]|uniref:Integrator complex subunit 10 n=1 Tax=Hyalella azteca TaxID=294128 RepID=A0A8B7N996_HYAAZ|nr:integrator complex subunit 10 [Hyalella azteca]
MVPDIELVHLTDEEFLIHRAKEFQASDQSASKAWLITAQVLYPSTFKIQFEVYLIEKAAKNVSGAARCLSSLIQDFPQESLLFLEIDAIMLAVQASNSFSNDNELDFMPPADIGSPSIPGPDVSPADEKTHFHTQIFYALPKHIQRGLVLNAAERCTDTMSHCSLLLLLTSHFPETTHLQAPNLVETLLSAEKMCPSPLNPYRKKLVCSVLPVLVGGEASGVQVSFQLLLHLLCLALEYYTALLYSSPVRLLAAPKSSGSVSTGCGSENSSPGCAQLWSQVFLCIRQLGARFDWVLAKHFTPDANREGILQHVQAVMKTISTGPPLDNEKSRMELLYVITILFLHALHEYTTNIKQEAQMSSSVGLTLVEAFTASAANSRSSSVCSDDLDVLSPPRPKRHRTSQDIDTLVPHISVGQGEGVCSGGLPQALTTAIKCWDLLHSHSKLRSEFTALLERLKVGSPLRAFRVDMLLHDFRLTEANREVRAMLAASSLDVDSPASPKPAVPFSPLELRLKLASINYALNNFSGATEAALEAIRLLPPPSATAPTLPGSSAALLPPAHSTTASSSSSSITITAGSERHLHLLPLSRAHCLQFIVTLLINALKTRVFQHKFHDDLSIGHLLTLVQFEWPKHELVFMELVGLLIKQGSLNYEQFSLYVTTPEIIEELVYLHTRDGGGLHLDIVPPPPHISKMQRTVSTRGADRGSKHDFKQAMRKQMQRCDESVAQNIITFLENEGQSLHQNFM